MKKRVLFAAIAALLVVPQTFARTVILYDPHKKDRAPKEIRLLRSPVSTTISYDELSALAPAADPHALALGLSAMQCAQAHGTGLRATRLAVIDYSLPSSTPRLWVFDLARHRLLYHELVAHGKGSGDETARYFSNYDGTHASSLGLFYTQNTYQGHNGYSLRLAGLDRGFNDSALKRAIVLHGAPYVSARNVQEYGKLGRSWGCPAVSKAMARPIIDVLKGGQFVFSYYPQQAWLTRSTLAQCAQARLNGRPDSRRSLAAR